MLAKFSVPQDGLLSTEAVCKTVIPEQVSKFLLSQRQAMDQFDYTQFDGTCTGT